MSHDEEFQESELSPEMLESKPIAPLPSDCCGGGCNPCVNDIYEQELQIWRKDCLKKIQGSENLDVEDDQTDSKETRIISKDSYTEFTLQSITAVTRDTNIYRFVIPGNRKLNLKPGEHLILRCYSDKNSPITRQYTPISPCDAHGYFDVLIKLYDKGKMSRCLRNWRVGDSKEWRGPFGSFSYGYNQYRAILMIAAGTGITPMAQIICHVLSNEDDYTTMMLLYSCRTYEDILLKDNLDEWRSYWNFTVHYYLTHETDVSKEKYGEVVSYQRIDHQNLMDDACAVFGSQQIDYKNRVLVVICGPKSFNNDMKKNVVEIGIKDDNCVVF